MTILISCNFRKKLTAKHLKKSKIICFRKNYRRVRVNVECCEQLSEFGGWLRSILTQVDACPNLLSFDKRENCPAACSMMALEPYMKQNGHINMAHLSTIPSKQLPKKLPNTSISGVRARRGRTAGAPLKLRIVQPPKQNEQIYIDDEASRDSIITTSSTDSDSLDSSDLSEDFRNRNTKVWPSFKPIEADHEINESGISLFEKHLQERSSQKISYLSYENNTPTGKIRAVPPRPLRKWCSVAAPVRAPASNGGIVVTRANGGLGPRIRAPAVSLYSFVTNGNRFVGRGNFYV